MMLGGSLREKRAFLKEHDIEDPLNAISVYENSDRCLWISQSMKEASYPLAIAPNNGMQVGPIYLSTAPALKKDAELASLLRKGPTLLINMGNIIRCTEGTVTEIVKSLRILFDNVERVQMLWKLQKSEFGDEFLSAVSTEFINGRLRLERWPKIDPGTIMETGNVVCILHHGGANSFNDAIGYAAINLLHF
jgi:hypothetical protein